MNIDFHWLENRIFHRTLGEEEKNYLAGIIEPVAFEPGESILVQNEPGGALYLLYSGKADVLLQFADMEVRLNGVGEGAQLGDMSIIEEKDASATIRATEPCRAYKLNRDALSRMLHSRDDIGRDLLLNTLRNMSDVIREMNQSSAAAHSYIQGRRV